MLWTWPMLQAGRADATSKLVKRVRSGLEISPFCLGPFNGKGSRLEPPRKAEIAIVKDLRLHAPFAVIAKLTCPSRVVLAELPEGFAGSVDDPWCWRQSGLVERVLCHSYGVYSVL